MDTLLDIFQRTKDILCKYDYYIYISKKIIHLTNSELKIPHLMGMQYVGRGSHFTGDYGVYAIKKNKVSRVSVEKMVKKYYKTEEKQRKILEMIYRKWNNLHLLEEMFHSNSQLYLYEKKACLDTKFDCDYLMVHEMEKVILHLGFVKSANNYGVYHCNSFMATYQSDKEKDLFFCNLSKRYEIDKIVKEEKVTKHAETIYQSPNSECREREGIVKMFAEEGFLVDRKLVTEIIRVNQMFGKYHLLHELNDINAMLQKCHEKKEEELVLSMSQLLSDLYLQKEEETVAEGNATTWREVRKGLNLSQEDEYCIALDKQAIKSDILA